MEKIIAIGAGYRGDQEKEVNLGESSLINNEVGMKNQDLANALELGKTSFANGHFKNPYQEGTLKHKEWFRGFDLAYFENLGGSDAQRVQPAHSLAV